MIATNDNRPDDSFGLCPVCCEPGLCINVGPNHWFICETHRVKWCFGSNIFSGWREETEADWSLNAARLSDHREVEPFHWSETVAAPVASLAWVPDNDAGNPFDGDAA